MSDDFDRTYFAACASAARRKAAASKDPAFRDAFLEVSAGFAKLAMMTACSEREASPACRSEMKGPIFAMNARVADLISLEQSDRDSALFGAELLRIGALQDIANGIDDPQQLADAALRTVDVDLGGR